MSEQTDKPGGTQSALTDKPDGKPWKWWRGLIGALALSLACQVTAACWIVSSLGGNTARIQRPYNELWYVLAVNAPAAILWFWYFARPHR